MTINPDPYVMTIFARQRHEAFQSEADRHRLATLAVGNLGAHQRRHWSERVSVVAVAATLALLAAGAVAVQEPASQPLAALSEAADSVTQYLLATGDQATSAVQKVREAEPAADADLAKATPKLILGKITFTDILVS